MIEVMGLLTGQGGCIVVVRDGELYLEPSGEQWPVQRGCRDCGAAGALRSAPAGP